MEIKYIVIYSECRHIMNKSMTISFLTL